MHVARRRVVFLLMSPGSKNSRTIPIMLGRKAIPSMSDTRTRLQIQVQSDMARKHDLVNTAVRRRQTTTLSALSAGERRSHGIRRASPEYVAGTVIHRFS